MDHFKTKLNSSVNLGKTATRRPTPHSKSFILNSAENTLTRAPRESSQAKKKSQPGSVHNTLLGKPAPSKQFSVAGSMALINQNRKYCSSMSTQLQASIVAKTLKVNKMMKQVNHLIACFGDLKWLLFQGDKLVQQHLKETQLLAPESSHTQNLAQLAKQFKSLTLKFGIIDRPGLKSIEQWLMNTHDVENQRQNTNLSNTPLSSFEEGRPTLERRQTGPIEGLSLIRQEPYETKGLQQQYHMPMKQNYNRSNFTNRFENIKLIPSKVIHERQQTFPEPILSKNYINHEQQQRNEYYEQIEQENERLQKVLREEVKSNEQLKAVNQNLREQIQLLNTRVIQLKVSAKKSIEKMGDIFQQMVADSTPTERQFQLMKIAQCLVNWQQTIDQQKNAVYFKQLYEDKSAFDSERTRKLQEIIGLQYEINNLFGQKEQRELMRKKEDSFGQDLYRMLSVQALCLEQLIES